MNRDTNLHPSGLKLSMDIVWPIVNSNQVQVTQNSLLLLSYYHYKPLYSH